MEKRWGVGYRSACQHPPAPQLEQLPTAVPCQPAYGFAVVVASDKLFYWLYHNQPDRILPLLPDLPALILEAQMAADGGFLRRLYAETARLLQQEPSIERWRVVVLCPSRQLNFGDPAPVAEFVEQQGRGVCGAAGPTPASTSSLRAQADPSRSSAPWAASPSTAKVTLRLLIPRCGPLSAEQDSVIRSLPLERLEALAKALLDFESMADLHAWLAANA